MAEDQGLVIEQARNGDREAFGKLVQTYQQRVYMTAYRMMGNHDDANDVAQEAFVRAFHGMARFDGRAEFFTWLYRIVTNVSLNHLRGLRRRRSVAIDDVKLPESLLRDAGDDPRKILEMKQRAQEIATALDELSDTLRATVVLVIMEGFSYRETAEILDSNEGTIAWRVYEARQKLRIRLENCISDIKK